MGSCPLCYRSYNDVGAVTTNGLSIDAVAGYTLTGAGITVGSGGITGTDPNSPGQGGAAAELALPVTLAGSETWNITNGVSGGGLLLSDGLAGPGDDLTVNLSDEGNLALDGDDTGIGISSDTEIGNVSITGGGGFSLENSRLNATDGSSLSIDDSSLSASSAIVGNLTSTDGQVVVGASATSYAGGLTTHSATFDSTSSIVFNVDDSGARANVDYGQLSSPGLVDLGGATLAGIRGFNFDTGGCVVTPAGDVLTLISATEIDGEFANAPDGSVITDSCAIGSSTGDQYQIAYNTTSIPMTVTATAIAPTTTSLSASPASPVAGEPVTLVASISPKPAFDAPTGGTVAFSNNGTVIPGCGNAAVSSTGVAVCPTAFPAGDYEDLTTAFTPASAADLLPSTGGFGFTLEVGAASTASSLEVPSTAAVGSKVSYTAVVTPEYSGIMPRGDVCFHFDSGQPCTAVQVTPDPTHGDSTATLTVAYGSPGMRTITAQYLAAEDPNFTTSESSARTIYISAPPATGLAPASTITPTVAATITPAVAATITPTVAATSALERPLTRGEVVAHAALTAKPGRKAQLSLTVGSKMATAAMSRVSIRLPGGLRFATGAKNMVRLSPATRASGPHLTLTSTALTARFTGPASGLQLVIPSSALRLTSQLSNAIHRQHPRSIPIAATLTDTTGRTIRVTIVVHPN
jgi:hypothetical protein